MPSLRALWLGWRNRMLSSSKFQRFCADFFPTRPIAHARAQALFDIVAGFVYAQVLAACARLDLFERVRAGPKTSAALAAQTNLPLPSLQALLSAAQALNLLEHDGRGYVLGVHGAALLGNPGLGDMIAHHAALYDDLRDPLRLMREGRGEAIARYWPYATANAPTDDQRVAPYSILMAATQPAVAADILDAYAFQSHRVVMDVGGGEGAFLSALHTRWPQLRLRLFDLPAVVARAAERGLDAERVGGDFLRDPLPSGADLITFVRILHDHDDAGVAKVLASARAALEPGGRVLIAEPMRGRSRFAGAYLAMYLLAMGRGRPRTPGELKRMLCEAGFDQVRMLRVRNPALLRILVAEAKKIPGRRHRGLTHESVKLS